MVEGEFSKNGMCAYVCNVTEFVSEGDTKMFLWCQTLAAGMAPDYWIWLVLKPIVNGGALINFAKFEESPLLILTPRLLILAMFESILILIDHFPEDVNAGAVVKLF